MPECPVCRRGAARPRWKVGAARIDYCPGCQAFIRRDAGPPGGSRAGDRFGTWWSGPGEGATASLKAATAAWHLERLERVAYRGRLLDVGCGSGDLVRVAVARGWEAEGLDLAPAAVVAAREAGVKARLGPLSPEAVAGQRFDAVTLMDVLEHTQDPAALLADVRRVLKPEGWLLLATPDAASLSARLMGRWWPMWIPEHHVCFTRAGLVRLLERAGFEAAQAWTSLRAVSLAYLAAHLRHDPRPALAGLGRLLGQAVPVSIGAWAVRLPLGSCAVLARSHSA